MYIYIYIYTYTCIQHTTYIMISTRHDYAIHSLSIIHIYIYIYNSERRDNTHIRSMIRAMQHARALSFKGALSAVERAATTWPLAPARGGLSAKGRGDDAQKYSVAAQYGGVLYSIA